MRITHKSTTELVETSFQYVTEIDYTNNLNLLNDFFIRFYPYILKDRIKCARKWKIFCFTTSINLRDYIKRLAAERKMSFNDYLVRTLSHRAVH
jgi:hypothetical protein